MARLKFLGFDLQGNGVPCTANTLYDYVACDVGTEFCSRTSDSDFHPFSAGTYKVCTGGGRVGGAGLGYAGPRNAPLDNNFPFSSPNASCATVLRSSINNVSEIWVSFDVFYLSPGNQFFSPTIPSTWQRSEYRWQIFKFGDLALRLKSMTPKIGGYDISFSALNGAVELGEIVLPGLFLLSGIWINVRARAKLASSGMGRFDLLIGGVSASFTGLDSTATTPLESVDRVWFCGGGLQEPEPVVGNLDAITGTIDNILIDDAGFPTGRPVVATVTSGFSDTSISNWASTQTGGTISSAVLSVDSIRARGTGNGARAILDIPAPTMTTWNANLLGYQIVPGLLCTLDNVNIKRLKAGVRFNSTDRFGSLYANATPPFSPDRFQNLGTDTIFYNGGTTDFLKANVASTDVVLEVTS